MERDYSFAGHAKPNTARSWRGFVAHAYCGGGRHSATNKEVHELRETLQHHVDMWQGWLDTATAGLATVRREEKASKDLWEDTRRQYHQALKVRMEVIQERSWRVKEKAMN